MAPDDADGDVDGPTVQYTTDPWTARSLVDDANASVGHAPGSKSEGTRASSEGAELVNVDEAMDDG